MTKKNFEKHFGHTYSKKNPKEERHWTAPSGHQQLKETAKSHETVVGQPPKNWSKAEIPSECRFIIPDVPANQDIFMASYFRTQALLGEVVDELHTNMKLKDGDTEHDIEVLTT
jgi:hypothetical protein